MKNKFRLIFALILLFSFTSLPFSASAQSNLEQESLLEIENEFNELKQEYNLEEFDPSTITEDQFLDFDSVEQFEDFIQDIQHQKFDESINISQQNQSTLPFSTLATKYYNDSHVINWYSPYSGWGLTTAATWKNIAFEYRYYFSSMDLPKFEKDSIKNIDSYLTGINAIWWEQKTKHANLTTTYHIDDTVVIGVSGNYVLGVSINGFTMGAKVPGSWEGSLRLY